MYLRRRSFWRLYCSTMYFQSTSKFDKDVSQCIHNAHADMAKAHHRILYSCFCLFVLLLNCFSVARTINFIQQNDMKLYFDKANNRLECKPWKIKGMCRKTLSFYFGRMCMLSLSFFHFSSIVSVDGSVLHSKCVKKFSQNKNVIAVYSPRQWKPKAYSSFCSFFFVSQKFSLLLFFPQFHFWAVELEVSIKTKFISSASLLAEMTTHILCNRWRIADNSANYHLIEQRRKPPSHF